MAVRTDGLTADPSRPRRGIKKLQILLLVACGLSGVTMFLWWGFMGTPTVGQTTPPAPMETTDTRVREPDISYTLKRPEPPPVVPVVQVAPTPAPLTNHQPVPDESHEKLLQGQGQTNQLLGQTNTLLRDTLTELRKPKPVEKAATTPPVVQAPPAPQKPSLTAEERRALREKAQKEADEKREKLKSWKPPAWVTPEAPKLLNQAGKVLRLKTPWSLTPNTLIHLLTDAKLTNEQPGDIRAMVSQTVYDSATARIPVLPQGAFIGLKQSGKTLVGDESMAVKGHWLTYGDRMVKLPPHSAGDREGTPGFRDQVDHHYGRIVALVLANSVLKLGNSVTVGGMGVDTNISDQAAQSLAQESSREGQKQTQQFIRTDPTITIRLSYAGTILLTEPLELNQPLVP